MNIKEELAKFEKIVANVRATTASLGLVENFIEYLNKRDSGFENDIQICVYSGGIQRTYHINEKNDGNLTTIIHEFLQNKRKELTLEAEKVLNELRTNNP